MDRTHEQQLFRNKTSAKINWKEINKESMYSKFPAIVDGKPTMVQTSGNYIRIQNQGRRVPEHRLIMEQHLGRKLDRDEVVHHINGDKSDNRIENLEVWPLENHSRLHMYEGRTLKKETVEKLRELGQRKRPGASNDPQTVRIIKKMIKAGRTNKEIAEELGKSRFYISKIRTGYNWGWLDK